MSASIASLIETTYAQEREGKIAAALATAQEALQAAVGHPEETAAASARLALLYFRVGNHPRACTLAHEALALTSEGSPARADAWLALGCCAAETDDLAAAEDHFLHAVALSRETGYTRALLRALHDLGAGVHFPQGRFDLAIAAEEEVLRLARDGHLAETACKALITLAWIAWLTGQPERAAAALAELDTLALAGSLDEGYGLWIRGNLALDEGRADAAELYARARSNAESVGEPGLNVLVRLGMSRHRQATGDAPAARDWADDALRLATRTKYQHLRGMALIRRGRAAWQMGDLTGAEADIREARAALEPQQLEYDLAHAELLLAALLDRAGNPQEAASTWITAANRIITRGYGHLLERERAIAFPLLAAMLGRQAKARSLARELLGYLQHVSPPPLRIRLLGEFRIHRQGLEIDRRSWHRRRAGELLRLLASTPGHALLRDAVVEALWPDYAGDPLPVLHQATSAVRRALEPDLPGRFPSRYLGVEEERVALRLPPGSWIDAEEFEERVRREDWQGALDLWGGEPLPDDRYADWAAGAREHYAQIYLRALYGRAQQALDSGQWQQALDAAREILNHDPWQERAVSIAMRAYLAQGDRPGAVALYLELEHTLHNDLGIAPQAELRRLYEQAARA